MVAKCNTKKCSTCACDKKDPALEAAANDANVFDILMHEVQEIKQLLKQYKTHVDKLENAKSASQHIEA